MSSSEFFEIKTEINSYNDNYHNKYAMHNIEVPILIFDG